MSLDLANKAGRAHNTTNYVVDGTTITDLSGIVEGTFDSGDVDKAGKFLLQVDTSTNVVDLATLPTTLALASGAEAFTDGVEITVVKNSTDAGSLTFTDPVTGIVFNYADRQGESVTLVFDTSTGTGQWVAKI